LFPQNCDCLLVVADQVGSDAAGIVGAQSVNPRTLYGNKLTMHFYLRKPARRKY
jgi:hypothetical protein